ncbi:hypothetical protein [Methanosphaera sp.]|uniref:hypothetical protein n=1 Tax=Methanosphaera sp. TaxID=2666342 RepID=UPI0025E34006|nr:hypothetical protein [Methanosphaera sp.]
MTRKEMKPTKARLLGNILPNYTKLMQSTEYEDFIVERTEGAKLTYKEIVNGTSMDLNFDSVYTELSVGAWDVLCGDPCTISLALEGNSAPLANEPVTLKVDGRVYKLVTDDDGHILFTDYVVNTVKENILVEATYLGNTSKKYAPCNGSALYSVNKILTSFSVDNVSGNTNEEVLLSYSLEDYMHGLIPKSGVIRLKNPDGVVIQTYTITGGLPDIYVNIADAGTYTYSLEYDGLGVYEDNVSYFVVTTAKKSASIIVQSTATGSIGQQSSVPVRVEYNGQNIRQGTIRVKQGSTVVDEFALNSRTSIRITPTSMGSKVYTVEYVDAEYLANSKSFTLTVDKEPVTFTVEGNTITYSYLYDVEPEGLRISMKGSYTNTTVTSGTVSLYMLHEESGIDECIGEFDCDDYMYGGVMELMFTDLDLTALKSATLDNSVCFFNTYTLRLEYSPASQSNYLYSEDVKEFVSIESRQKNLELDVDVYLNTTTTAAGKTYRIDFSNTAWPKVCNFGLLPINSKIYMGSTASTYWVPRQEGGVWGVGYSVQMRINGGTLRDISSTIRGDSVTGNTGVLLSSLNIDSNTFHVGDTVEIIHSYSKGFFKEMGTDTNIGAQLILKFQVTSHGTGATYPEMPVTIPPLTNWTYALPSSGSTSNPVTPTITDGKLLPGRQYFVYYNEALPSIRTQYSLRIEVSFTRAYQRFRLGRVVWTNDKVNMIGVNVQLSDYVDSSQWGHDYTHLIDVKVLDKVAYVYIDGTYTGVSYDMNSISDDVYFGFYGSAREYFTVHSIQYYGLLGITSAP